MHKDDGKGKQDIKDTHDRNKGPRYMNNTFTAAHDAVTNRYGKKTANDPRCGGFVIEAIYGEGGLQVVRSKQVEAAGIGHNKGDGKSNGQRLVVEGCFNVVGRAAIAVAIGIFAFIDLGHAVTK